ncbi:MAG: hypothetical protein SOY30_04915, partial [Eubacteriales bacterium]|nr:hypothetical protein [Eubacteriales bacterium]
FMNQFYTPGQAYRCRNSARHFYLRHFGKCGLCAADARLASFRKAQTAKAAAAKPAAASVGTSSGHAYTTPPTPPRPTAAPQSPPKPPTPPSAAPAQQKKSGSPAEDNANFGCGLLVLGFIVGIILLMSRGG